MNIKTNPKLCLRMFGILVLPAFLAIFSCSKKAASYPEPITQAIDLFFQENKNDSVLLLLDYPAFLQNENTTDSDLRKIFSAAALCEKGLPDSAYTIYQTVKSVKNNDKLYYYHQSIGGLIDFRLNDHRSSYEKLLFINSSKTQDIRALALNERIIGRIMQAYTDFKSSINWYLSSKQHFESAGLEKSVAVNNKFIGSACNKSQLLDEAISYLKEAEETFIKYKDNDELFYVYIVMIDHYIQLNVLDTATIYANKALKAVDFEQDLKMKSHVYNNLGEIEMLKKNYPDAIEMFRKTIALGENYYSAPKRNQFAYISLGKIYNILNQPEEANKNLQIALKMLGDTQDRNKFEVYKELAKVNTLKDRTTANNMLDSSLFYARKYYNSQSGNVIKSFETQHELENVKNRMTKMRQDAKTHRILTGIGTLLSLMIIFTLYRTTRIRKEKNKILKDLVVKNLKLLEEERKVNQAMKDTNICIKKSKRTPTDEERSNIIFGDLVEWLEKDNNFLRNDISLESVAKEIGTNRDYLSRSISDHDTRFPELINKYRINEAIRILTDKSDTRNKYSLQIIASEVGFNSHSTFIDAFRKQTSMTPVQFRDQMLDLVV